ncbi:MAG: rhodanese-like domain-containing protein [Patescibacteria group bacterium]|jgi:rhodanese-related sulfurtransferase|nr:rhodanese-like domain-containing protein [Patescibacteria group bacterium]
MNRIIIDVREPEEYQRGHVESAINIPPDKIIAGASELADIPKDTELILYCVSGSRSRVASQYLMQQGFSNVVNGINKDHVLANYC